MMKRLFLLLAILFPALAYGQGSEYHDTVFGASGRPHAGALVTVCTVQPANTFCPSANVNIFQNQALTIAQSNPIISDSRGNFTFWAPAGTYTLTVSGIGVFTYPYTIVLPCIVGSSCASAGGFPQTVVAFSATPSFDATYNASYAMPLTGNVTAIAIIGTPVNGNLLRFAFTQDATGGRTVAFPGNFVIPTDFALRVQPLSSNNLTFLYNGTNWYLLDNITDGSLDYYSISFSSTPTFSNSRSAYFDFTLTGNVSSSVFTTTGRNGTQFVLNACQDGVGGRTFAFPGNVSNPQGFTFDTTASHCNRIYYTWNGTLWNGIGGGTGGGGGGTPGNPVGCLQKNASGSFGAANVCENGTTLTVDDDAHTKGPNPEFDITRYGARALAFPALTTSANCTNTLTSVTLGSALDFVNGDGIVLHQCGAATSLTTPTAPSSVVPKGILNGSTTRSYKVAAEDFSLGVTAAGSATTITNAAATFQSNPVNISTASLVSGTISITTTSNHNFEAASPIKITGCSATINGVWMVKTTPTGATLTIDTPYKSRPDIAATCSTGTVEVPAHNFVYFTSQATAMRYLIYRQDGGAGSYNLVGIAQGIEPFYDDYNWGTPNLTGMPEVPATAPSIATNQALPTTIVSGAGGTSIVVANAASNTASGISALHDNTVPILAAHNAALAVKGGEVFVPNAAGNLFYLNFPLAMPPVSNNGNVTYIVSGGVFAQQPIKNTLSTRVIGKAPNNHGTPSFATTNYGSIGGTAYPVMFLASQNEIDHMYISHSSQINPGQWTIVCDQNCVTDHITDSYISVGANDSGAVPLVLRGIGFGYLIEKTVFSGTTSTKYFAPALFRIAGSNLQSASPGEGVLDHVKFFGGQGLGVDNDAIPSFAVTQQGSPWTFHEIFSENNCGPLFGFHNINNSNWFNWSIDLIIRADSICGIAPQVEMSAGVSLLDGLRMSRMEQGGTGASLLNTGTAANNISFFSESENDQYNFGTSYAIPQLSTVYGAPGAVRKTGKVIEANSVIRVVSPGVIIAQGDPPTNLAGVVVAGGTLPIGTFNAAVTAVDANGGQSGPSIPLSVTTTGGNQSVQFTWTAPSPAPAGYYVYFNGTAVNSGTLITTTSVTATNNLFQAIPFTAGGGPSGMSKTLVWGSKVQGGGFASAPTTVKTSSYTPTINDNIIPVDASAGGFTVSLNPAIIGSHWVILRKDNTGANTVTISGTSGTIDGAASTTLAVLSGITVTCDGTNCQTESRSSGGGGGNIANALQYSTPFYDQAGSTNHIAGVPSPTVNGTYVGVHNVVASVAVPYSDALLGVPISAQNCHLYTLLYSDRAGRLLCTTGAAETITLPAIASNFGSNFPFQAYNGNSGNLTLTATAPNTIDGSGAGGSSVVIPGWMAHVGSDNTPAWSIVKVPTFGAFTGSCQAITFNSSTGFPCATLFYQLTGNNGTSQTARNRLNFIPGTNITFSFSDNAGTNSTDLIINSSGGGGGGGTPCTTTALSLQYNNGGAFGCVTEFTYTSSTITASASGKLDLSAASVTAGLKIPSSAGAAPVTASVPAYDSIKNEIVFGNGVTTLPVGVLSQADYYQQEEWTGAAIAGNLAGWNCGVGTCGSISSVAGHYGIINVSTTASSGTIVRFGERGTGNNGDVYPDIHATMWLETWVVKLAEPSCAGEACTINAKYRLGIMNTWGTDPPGSGFYFEAVEGGTNNSNIKCVTNNAGTSTSNDSGTALDTNWHVFKIFNDGSGASTKFYIDGTLVCTNTTNLPTASPMFPDFQSVNTTANAKITDFDFWSMYIATPR